MNNSPCRKPDGPYLIESAPKLKQYLAAKAAIELVDRILYPLNAAVSGYRAELRHMMGAGAIYIWPGR